MVSSISSRKKMPYLLRFFLLHPQIYAFLIPVNVAPFLHKKPDVPLGGFGIWTSLGM
jgi:hypothetical protein